MRSQFKPILEAIEARIVPAVAVPGVITPPVNFFVNPVTLINFDTFQMEVRWQS